MAPKLNHLTDQDLLNLIKARWPNLLFTGASFWDYENGLYRSLDNEVVKKRILDILSKNNVLGKNADARRIDNVFRLAKTAFVKAGNIFDTAPNILVFKNCVLNLKTLRQQSHSPKHFATMALPYSYDPEETCPNFLEVFKNFSTSKVNFLQEYSGHTISSDPNRETSVWLIGSSGAGKSTFLEGLHAAFGDFMKTINPNDMWEDKFWLSTLVGARVITASEMPDKTWRNNSIYNQLVSEEEVVIRPIYEPAYRARLRLRFFFAMNVLPDIFYAEDGIWRRLQIVRFPDLPPSERDITLKLKIMQEGPGIMNWALQGLKRLRKRGNFYIPDDVAIEKLKHQKRVFNMAEFIDDRCIKEEGKKIQAQDLMNSVAQYCREKDLTPPSPQDISGFLQEEKIRKGGQKGKIFYYGISLN